MIIEAGQAVDPPGIVIAHGQDDPQTRPGKLLHLSEKAREGLARLGIPTGGHKLLRLIHDQKRPCLACGQVTFQLAQRGRGIIDRDPQPARSCDPPMAGQAASPQLQIRCANPPARSSPGAS